MSESDTSESGTSVSVTSESAAPADDLTLDEAGALAPLATPADAQARVAAGAFLIDMRGDESFTRDGAVDGAVRVDRFDLERQFGLDSADRRPEVVDHDTPIVVVCGSVRGSGPVAKSLIAQGFTNVVHVDGGAPAWKQAASGDPAEFDPALSGDTCSI